MSGSLVVPIITLLVYFWKKWTIEIVVLISFVLKLVLLLFAGIRRRRASGVRVFLVWLSYQLANSTAVYGLGHLSINGTSVSRERQQLVAFWAPLLLVHLGGPDNISAYAIQDNELWLRLVSTFFTNILGAAYTIFVTSSSGSGAMLSAAAWLMFVVGAVKYGEMIYALYEGHLSTIRSTIEKQKRDELKKKEKTGDKGARASAPPPPSSTPALSKKDPDHPDNALLQAHLHFSACKAALVDISWAEEGTFQEWSWPKTWIVLQMEVSLLYDIMYTKAGVIHTWHGYCIRVFSPLATAGALLLFHLSLGTSHGDMLVDVAIIYSLLVGSILVDTWWLLVAGGSTWAYASLMRMPRRGRLYHAAVCSGRWRQVRRLLGWIRRLVKAEDSRRWSGTIWQHNMLQFCTRDESKDVWYDLAKKIYVEWRKKENNYSGTTVIHDRVMEQVFNSLLKILQVDDESREEIERDGDEDVPQPYMPDEPLNSVGLLRAERGRRALQAAKKHDKDIYRKFGRFIRDEIQEQIIIWHIATDIYLRTRKEDYAEGAKTTQNHVKAIKLLSNYIMFLLVERPYMLPGLALRTIYNQTVQDMDAIRKKKSVLTTDELAKKLKDTKINTNNVSLSALPLATSLARSLDRYDKVEFLFEVWVEILYHVSHRCRRESHAKQLSSGGELTTIVWIMAEHARNFYIQRKLRQRLDVLDV